MGTNSARQNCFEATTPIVRDGQTGVCFALSTKEHPMTDTIQVAKRILPVEQIALIEPFVRVEGAELRSTKEFKARIILLNKDSILSLDTPEQLAKAHAFRIIIADRVATNPAVGYWVEIFEPVESFQSARPFRTRLLWRGPDRMAHSKLLVASPETVLAVAVRGDRDPDAEPTDRDGGAGSGKLSARAAKHSA
jgi:hypothetical protein